MLSKPAAQLDAEIAEALRARQWQEQVARDEAARRSRAVARVIGPSPAQLHEERQADMAAGIFHGEVRGRAHQLRQRFRVERRQDRETQTRDDHPGLSPPHQGDLAIGRGSESWKPLYWRKLLAAYDQETRHASANTIVLNLWIGHAPDDHTPIRRLDWPDSRDVRGAEKAARKLVEAGHAQFATVHARASRPHGQKVAVYTLASFARDTARSPL